MQPRRRLTVVQKLPRVISSLVASLRISSQSCESTQSPATRFNLLCLASATVSTAILSKSVGVKRQIKSSAVYEHIHKSIVANGEIVISENNSTFVLNLEWVWSIRPTYIQTRQCG